MKQSSENSANDTLAQSMGQVIRLNSPRESGEESAVKQMQGLGLSYKERKTFMSILQSSTPSKETLPLLALDLLEKEAFSLLRKARNNYNTQMRMCNIVEALQSRGHPLNTDEWNESLFRVMMDSSEHDRALAEMRYSQLSANTLMRLHKCNVSKEATPYACVVYSYHSMFANSILHTTELPASFPNSTIEQIRLRELQKLKQTNDLIEQFRSEISKEELPRMLDEIFYDVDILHYMSGELINLLTRWKLCTAGVIRSAIYSKLLPKPYWGGTHIPSSMIYESLRYVPHSLTDTFRDAALLPEHYPRIPSREESVCWEMTLLLRLSDFMSTLMNYEEDYDSDEIKGRFTQLQLEDRETLRNHLSSEVSLSDSKLIEDILQLDDKEMIRDKLQARLSLRGNHPFIEETLRQKSKQDLRDRLKERFSRSSETLIEKNLGELKVLLRSRGNRETDIEAKEEFTSSIYFINGIIKGLIETLDTPEHHLIRLKLTYPSGDNRFQIGYKSEYTKPKVIGRILNLFHQKALCADYQEQLWEIISKYLPAYLPPIIIEVKGCNDPVTSTTRREESQLTGGLLGQAETQDLILPKLSFDSIRTMRRVAKRIVLQIGPKKEKNDGTPEHKKHKPGPTSSSLFQSEKVAKEGSSCPEVAAASSLSGM